MRAVIGVKTSHPVDMAEIIRRHEKVPAYAIRGTSQINVIVEYPYKNKSERDTFESNLRRYIGMRIDELSSYTVNLDASIPQIRSDEDTVQVRQTLLDLGRPFAYVLLKTETKQREHPLEILELLGDDAQVYSLFGDYDLAVRSGKKVRSIETLDNLVKVLEKATGVTDTLTLETF